MKTPSQVLDAMFWEQELYIEELQKQVKELTAKNIELLNLAIETGRERSSALLQAALAGAFSPEKPKI